MLKSVFIILLLSMFNCLYAEKARIAVLTFKDTCKPPVGRFKLNILTESLRSAALKTGSFDVMTKENMKVMLPDNVDLEDCVGECEVETGRKLMVAYVVTGEIGLFDNKYEIIIRLHETQKGRLINQISLNASTIPKLRDQMTQNASELFSKIAQFKLKGAVGTNKSRSSLYLAFKPKQSRVRVDGSLINLKDFTQKGRGYLIPMPSGKHTISVEAKGYVQSTQEVFIPNDGIASVELSLYRMKQQNKTSCKAGDPQCVADLFVYTIPAGASIYVDGQNTQKRTTPVQGDAKLGAVGLSLTPGVHVIEARATRYVTARREIKLKAQDFDKSMEKNPIKLTPNFGRISIKTQPKDAVITLDGKMVAQRSPWKSELSAGAHQLRVIAPNHLHYDEVVVIDRGQLNDQLIKLVPSYSNVTLKVVERGSKKTLIQGAQVIVNQDLQNTYQTTTRGEAALSRVDQGTVSIQVVHPLFETNNQSLTVKSGGKKQVFTIELLPKYAYVSVSSKDSIDAEVFLSSGQTLGRLPLERVKVPTGNVTLTIRPKNQRRYATFRAKLALDTKENRMLRPIAFKERLGTLVINAQPLGADLYLDGKKIGTSPLKKKVVQGKHELKIKAAQYDPYIEVINVPEGERLMKNITLGQNPVIEVHCTPHYADVIVNGKRLGRTPQTYTDRPGSWSIHCAIPTGKSAIKKIKTRDSQQERVYLSVNASIVDEYQGDLSFKRWLMWGSLFLGSGLLATSGVYGLKTQGAASDRDVALETWRKALTVESLEAADRQFTQANKDADSYSSVATNTLVLGSALLLYSAYSYLTLPSLKKNQRSNQSSLKERQSEALEELDETSWNLFPVVNPQTQGVGVQITF